MGYQYWTHITVWTYLCSVCVLFILASSDTIIEDLGLEVSVDIKKINISQEEYSKMMSVYLDHLRNASHQTQQEIPKLLTFKSERKSWRRSKRDNLGKVYFPIRYEQDLEVESSELRLLAPAVPGTDLIHVRIYQILSTRRRRFVTDKLVYPSPSSPKWFDFDVTESVKSWLSGERNLGLQIECDECSSTLQPLHATVNALVLSKASRSKRSLGNEHEDREKTDCRSSDTKKRCCRHKLRVFFKDLNLAGMDAIVQPKFYEAGYCRGRCPISSNHATNHSRIQSIMHKANKTIPRVCCAPSKLEPVELLRVDPVDSTKLHLDKWDNMKVLECACS